MEKSMKKSKCFMVAALSIMLAFSTVLNTVNTTYAAMGISTEESIVLHPTTQDYSSMAELNGGRPSGFVTIQFQGAIPHDKKGEVTISSSKRTVFWVKSGTTWDELAQLAAVSDDFYLPAAPENDRDWLLCWAIDNKFKIKPVDLNDLDPLAGVAITNDLIIAPIIDDYVQIKNSAADQNIDASLEKTYGISKKYFNIITLDSVDGTINGQRYSHLVTAKNKVDYSFPKLQQDIASQKPTKAGSSFVRWQNDANEKIPTSGAISRVTYKALYLVHPTQKVSVLNKQNLTDTDKENFKQAIRDANANTEELIDDIVVAPNGETTVKYTGGDEVVLSVDDLATVTMSGQFDPEPPVTKVPVADPANLTDTEKEAVRKAIEDANENLNPTLPENTVITVEDDGTVTVNYPDGSTDTIQGTDVVKKSDAATNNPVAPDNKVPVSDPNALTPEEKRAVEDAIKEKNPTLPEDARVEVGNDGTVTVTYSDQSKAELPGNEVVVEREPTPVDPSTVDTDGDGLSDAREAELGTNPNETDTDHDGFTDREEVDQGTNPLDPNSKPATHVDPSAVDTDTDTDTDGLSDAQEAELGTNPNETDTDHDGFTDREEVDQGTNPLDASSKPITKKPAVISGADTVRKRSSKTVTHVDPSTVDTDGDGLSDAKEAELGTNPNEKDTDHDGFTDKEEVDQGTNPLDLNSKPVTPVDPSTVDTDGDGLSDAKEAELGTNPNEKDTDHDGFTDKEEVDQGTNPLDASSKPITKKPVVISGADTVRKQSKLPQTGDSANIFGYVGTLLASAGVLIGIGKKKKKEDEVE